MQVVDENGNSVSNQSSKRVVAGILAILLGSLGIHKFILGYTTEGVIMLLITIITCGLGGWLVGIIGLIEGIIYLTKSDEEFVQLYQANKKGWF
jgi:TM2 domain-containing membrane protein YozV